MQVKTIVNIIQTTGFLIYALLLAANAEAQPRTDTQFRFETEFEAPLNKQENLTLNFGGEFRLGRVAENRYVQPEIGLRYELPLGKSFSLVPRYRFRYTSEFRGLQEKENRFSLDGQFKWRVGSVDFTDYNVFELRLREGGHEKRYRNRLRMEQDISLFGSKWEGFLFRDWYYEGQQNRFTRRRTAIGIARELRENVQYELFYMRQKDKFSSPGDLHVFGIEVEVGLGKKPAGRHERDSN